MKLTNQILIVVMAFQLFIFGCAATPWTEQLRPIDIDLLEFESAQVLVDGSEGVRHKTGYESTASALSKELIENLQASKKFKTVGPNTQRGKVLQAFLLITDLNYVHGAARGFMGIGGGRAVLTVTMILKDQQTGRVLGAVKASDRSSHAQGILSPTTSRQVSAIAKEYSVRITGK